MNYESIPHNWDFNRGESPVITTAIHSGHNLRDEIINSIILDDSARLREEDPFTEYFATKASSSNITVHQSRFEIDLNRPRETAVYATPEQSWGLDVWGGNLSDILIERSLGIYDNFYQMTEKYIKDMLKKHGFFVLLDIHSYNHVRPTWDSPPADPDKNPEINVGLADLDESLWGNVVEKVISVLEKSPATLRWNDVRKNVKFRGGYFPRWVNRHFGDKGCAVALEFKKTFMNEWSGAVNRKACDEISETLSTLVEKISEMFVRCQ
ncbi:MAG: N-formylglutamate amidohydrolase [bacterium]